MIHAENAGVKNLIHFQQMDMRDVSTNKNTACLSAICRLAKGY